MRAAPDRPVTRSGARRTVLRRLLALARPHVVPLTLYLIAVVADGLVTAAVPLALRMLVDEGVLAGQRSTVVRLALVIAGLAVLDAGLTLGQRWLSARVGEHVVFDLRATVFRHVQRQPLAFFSRTRTGSLVTRVTDDLLGAQRAFTDLLASVVGNAATAGFVLLAMLRLSWPVTVACAVALPLAGLPARLLSRRLQVLTRRRLDAAAALSSMMTERFNVAGAALALLFVDPGREAEQFDRRAARLRDLGVAIAVRGRLAATALALVAGLVTALVYGWGGALAAGGALELGTLVALTACLARLYGPLNALASAPADVAATLVCFQRLFEVLDLDPAVAERPGAVELPRGPTGIELDGVDFGYPAPGLVSVASLEAVPTLDTRSGPQVLHGVSFRAAPGELVALVGPSGAGKTTISLLVPRLYDVTAGAVRLGGVDVRDATLASLRARVGVVTQDAHLFHDTLRANLVLARPDAGDDELLDALERAQLGSLPAQLPEGLDTVVGERGHRLSAGEKQRVALARILLKEPDVVVLDEATAHLDSESEAAVQRALSVALSGRTSLVIAHRLSTVRRADRILVVERGRIVEQGTHTELLAAGGRYARLHHLQFLDGPAPAAESTTPVHGSRYGSAG